MHRTEGVGDDRPGQPVSVLPYGGRQPAPVIVNVGAGRGGWVWLLLAVISVSLLLAGAGTGYYFWAKAQAWQGAVTSTLGTVVKSEEVLLLVNQKIQVHVTVLHREDMGALLGKRNATLEADVTVLWGINLGTVNEGAVRKADGVVYVRLPDPEALAVTPDLATTVFAGDRSGTVVAYDHVSGRDLRTEMETQIKPAAMEKLRNDRRLPTRGDLVDRLNKRAGTLFGGLPWKVVFE